MKKKGLMALLLALVCLLSVACGKDEESKEKKEEKSSIKTLECSAKKDDEEMSMTIKQDQKDYKFTEVSMSMTAPKKSYDDLKVSTEDLEKVLCEDDNEEYKSCKVKVDGDKVVVSMDFDLDKFEKEVVEEEDYDVDKIDGNTLSKIKEAVEKQDGYTCKLS